MANTEKDYTLYTYNSNRELRSHTTWYGEGSGAIDKTKQTAVYTGPEGEETMSNSHEYYRGTADDVTTVGVNETAIGALKSYTEYTYSSKALRTVSVYKDELKSVNKSFSIYDGNEGDEKIQSTQTY